MTAQELYDLRKGKKLTQQQMADWLGVKKRRLQSWEAALHPVPQWAVDKINEVPSLNPKLTLEEFQRLNKKAEEQGKTVEQLIADIIKAAILLAMCTAGLWMLL
ncbi:hypothetical protein [Prosthecobacter sp.]|uniref:hypothetical protein n=1 Tax=Prosthecobacter sp. TaxID=1965333 RepID=UPI0037CCC328